MKKLLYVLLAMTVAFAMIGCPTDSEDDPPPIIPHVPVVTVNGFSSVGQGLTATYTVVVDGVPRTTGITWSVTGQGTSSTTAIASTGVLTVDATETVNTTLTVKATIATGESGTKTVTVVDPTQAPSVDSIVVTTTDTQVSKGGTLQFTATVTVSNGASQNVTWSLSAVSNSSISATGLLSVGAAETASSITVTATSTDDPTKSDSETVTVASGVDTRLVINFYDYQGGQIVRTIRLEEEQSITNAGARLPPTPNRGNDFMWNGWKTLAGSEVNGDWSTSMSIDVYGTWYNGVFSGGQTEGAEKIFIERGGLPIYEFDLSTIYNTAAAAETGSADDKAAAGRAAVVTAIKGFKGVQASYGLSEATIMVGAPRARVYGPYFFNAGEAITLASATGGNTAGSKFWGDFKVDPNGKILARLDGTNTTPNTFNKFHSYFVFNGTYSNWPATTDVDTAKNTWINTTIDFVKTVPASPPTAAGTFEYEYVMQLLDSVLTDGTFSGTEVLKPTTDFTKVYFAIGPETSRSPASIVNTGQSIWTSGRVYLAKDVKIVTADDSTITGVRPNLTINEIGADPAYTVTSDQIFASYVDPVSAAWRGGPDDQVVVTHAPGYVPPPAYEPALTATEPLVLISSDGPSMKNDVVLEDGGYKTAVIIPLVFESDMYDIRSYAKFRVTVIFYAADGTTVIPDPGSGGGYGQSQFTKDVDDAYNQRVGGDVYNLAREDHAIPPAVLEWGPEVKGIMIKSGAADLGIGFIEVTSFTLLP
jgi:hypothetical protein